MIQKMPVQSHIFKSNAVEHKHPIYQTTSKSTLPETGKSISHSPVMAGIIALVLGLVILIHKRFLLENNNYFI